jgi:hypothetical protein
MRNQTALLSRGCMSSHGVFERPHEALQMTTESFWVLRQLRLQWKTAWYFLNPKWPDGLQVAYSPRMRNAAADLSEKTPAKVRSHAAESSVRDRAEFLRIAPAILLTQRARDRTLARDVRAANAQEIRVTIVLAPRRGQAALAHASAGQRKRPSMLTVNQYDAD